VSLLSETELACRSGDDITRAGLFVTGLQSIFPGIRREVEDHMSKIG
jgi:hypothetical protein